jgi:hypothetical protein
MQPQDRGGREEPMERRATALLLSLADRTSFSLYLYNQASAAARAQNCALGTKQ